MANNVKYITLTEDNFQQEVLTASEPVVVDFWAVWCGPCRLINPVITQVAKDFAGRAKVGKLNIDDYAQVASHYEISAIPSLLFFQNGQVVDRIVGMASSQVISDKLNALLQDKNSINSEAA